MASINNSLNGTDVNVSISTNLVTPAWKAIVCSQEDITLDGSTEGGTTLTTRCGVLKTAGTASWQITGSGVYNTSPGGSEVSGTELVTLFQDKTSFLVKIEYTADATDYYREGQGVLSSYTETSSIDGYVTFDFTVDISGEMDVTSA